MNNIKFYISFDIYIYRERERERVGKIRELPNHIYEKYYKMEPHKTFKLLNNSIVSKFVRRKWIELHDLSGNQYSAIKNIRF